MNFTMFVVDRLQKKNEWANNVVKEEKWKERAKCVHLHKHRFASFLKQMNPINILEATSNIHKRIFCHCFVRLSYFNFVLNL